MLSLDAPFHRKELKPNIAQLLSTAPLGALCRCWGTSLRDQMPPWTRGTGSSCGLRGAPIYFYKSIYAAIKGKIGAEEI